MVASQTIRSLLYTPFCLFNFGSVRGSRPSRLSGGNLLVNSFLKSFFKLNHKTFQIFFDKLYTKQIHNIMPQPTNNVEAALKCRYINLIERKQEKFIKYIIKLQIIQIQLTPVIVPVIVPDYQSNEIIHTLLVTQVYVIHEDYNVSSGY